MATIVQSFSTLGSVTKAAASAVPPAQVVAISDGEGAIVSTAPNQDTGTIISASGVTTTQVSPDIVNVNGRGVICVLNMTTVGTGSVTLSIQGKDSASGQYYTIGTGTAQTTNGTTFLTVYPGASSTAPTGSTNVSTAVPRIWRVQAVANNANATTYTVSANMIL